MKRLGKVSNLVGKVSALGMLTGLLVSLGLTQQAAAQGSGSATLDAAKARGQVLCGLSGQVPGFSLPDSQGRDEGAWMRIAAGRSPLRHWEVSAK